MACDSHADGLPVVRYLTAVTRCLRRRLAVAAAVTRWLRREELSGWEHADPAALGCAPQSGSILREVRLAA